MEVITLCFGAGQSGIINNDRPHNSMYRVTFNDGASMAFAVTAGGSFSITGNGLPFVIHIDNDIPAGIVPL